MIGSKETFLAEYIGLSSRRGKGFNCQGDAWDTLNVSGVQHRVARLSGIQDYSRRDLVDPLVTDWIGMQGSVYRWNLLDDNNDLLLNGTVTSEDKCPVLKSSLQAISLLREINVADVQAAITGGLNGWTNNRKRTILRRLWPIPI